jgi:hypothetical protein
MTACAVTQAFFPSSGRWTLSRPACDLARARFAGLRYGAASFMAARLIMH